MSESVAAKTPAPVAVPGTATVTPPQSVAAKDWQSTVPVVVVQTPEPKDSGVKDFLEFGQAFAWPVVIVALAVLFREQIAKKIENMASLKTPVAESSWNTQAGTVADLAEGIVEAEAIETPPADETPAVDPANGDIDTPQATSPSRRYDAVMPDTSNTEAVGAVILLWNAVEQAVRDLAVSRNLEARDFLAAYRWLKRTAVINPTKAELIDQLRMLRNDVVHLKGTEVDSDAYRRTVLAVLESLEIARRRHSPPPRSISRYNSG